MYQGPQQRHRKFGLVGAGVLLLSLVLAPTTSAQAAPDPIQIKPTFTKAAGFDVSKPLRDLAADTAVRRAAAADAIKEIRPDRGPAVADRGHSGDGAVQTSAQATSALRGGSAARGAAIPGTLANFEGLSNQDNFNVFGFRVNPPDPVGDVGPNHYVEMINLVFAVYSKTGTLLLGPVDTGTLWAGLPDRRVHRALGRPDRHLRPVRRPLDPDPVHHAWPRLPGRAG